MYLVWDDTLAPTTVESGGGLKVVNSAVDAARMSVAPFEAPGPGWRDWLVRSATARRLSSVMAVGGAVGALTAAAIALAALVRQRPVGGAVLLIAPAIPLVAAGQLWTIGWVQLRQPQRSGSWRRRSLDSAAQGRRNSIQFFFGPLDRRVALGLLAVAFSGWLLAMTAFPSMTDVEPATPGAGCQYQLWDHRGGVTCVPRSAYEHTQAGQQRFAAGILLAFFAIHTGAALGGRRIQRESSS
jgi:hypothetical protein